MLECMLKHVNQLFAIRRYCATTMFSRSSQIQVSCLFILMAHERVHSSESLDDSISKKHKLVESWKISENLGESRRISENLGESRRISDNLGKIDWTRISGNLPRIFDENRSELLRIDLLITSKIDWESLRISENHRELASFTESHAPRILLESLKTSVLGHRMYSRLGCSYIVLLSVKAWPTAMLTLNLNFDLFANLCIQN